eukprot:5738616-Heterocapsa_arctica.AAC.1
MGLEFRSCMEPASLCHPPIFPARRPVLRRALPSARCPSPRGRRCKAPPGPGEQRPTAQASLTTSRLPEPPQRGGNRIQLPGGTSSSRGRSCRSTETTQSVA